MSHYIQTEKIELTKALLDQVCPVLGYDNTPPDPEVFCTAEGYIPDPDPNVFCTAVGYMPDPAIYVPDPILEEVILPGDGVIRLVVEDAGMRTFQVKAAVTNSGKYVATIWGDGVEISSTLYTDNATATIVLPTEPGYLSSAGYYYYYVDITLELEANAFETFAIPINALYDALGGYIIAAFFNAPSIMSLHSAFENHKRIRYIEFLCDMPNLTTLVDFCRYTISVKKIIFKGLPEVTSLTYAFYATVYADVTWPTSIPKLNSANHMFYLAYCNDVVFSFEAPLLTTLASCFQLAKDLRSITFTPASYPELTTLHSFCKDVVGLPGTVIYPEMPKMTALTYLHMNNYNIEEVVLSGTMDSLTNWLDMCEQCQSLTRLVLPTSINSLVLSTSCAGTAIFDGATSLTELVLPVTWNTVHAIDACFLNDFMGGINLTSVSQVNSNGAQLGEFTGDNIISLERWDQPNAWWHSVAGQTLSFAKPDATPGALNYLEMDWANFPIVNISLENNNFDLAEVKRIIANVDPQSDPTPGTHTFNMAGNPLINPHWRYEPTRSGVHHTMTIYDYNFDPNIWKIGTSWYATQNNKNPSIIIRANNEFTLNTSWTSPPYNGVKIAATTELYSAYGFTPYKTFYVINSGALGSGSTYFQLSETEGGIPYEFGFGVELNNVVIYPVYASCNVTNIVNNGTYYTMTITFPYYPNSGSRYGHAMNPDEMDWWDFMERGFVPAF